MQQKTLLLVLFASLFAVGVKAQDPWLLTGNSNADLNSKLGTTNAIPLRFFANGGPRAVIDINGRFGIGTASPQQLFHVEGPTLLNVFVSTSPLSNISGSGQIGYTKFLPTAAGQRLGYFLVGSRGGAENNYHAAGMVGYAAGGWTAGSSYPAYLAFETTPSGSASRSERVRIDQNGNVGIGNSNPGIAGLMVDKKVGATHAIFGSNTPGISIESNFPAIGFNTYFSSAHKYIANGYGGLIEVNPINGNMSLYVTPASGTAGATAGFSQVVTLTPTSRVGIGDAAPAIKFVVTDNTTQQPTAWIKNLFNSTSFTDGLYITAGNNAGSPTGSWFAAFFRPDGGICGSISQASATSVAYNTTSDKRLKTNIRETHFGMADINKIQVRDYNFIGSKTEQTGYIAQQLYEVFPEAVTKGGDDPKTRPWMVDYGRITPLLVKGMQDMSVENEALKKQVSDLQTRLDRLEALLTKGRGAIPLTAAFLAQNIPNPSRGVTSIRYQVPDGAASAKLVLVNAKGQVLKEMNLAGRGAGQTALNTAGLAAGVYTYSLWVDGQQAATKQLVIAR